MGFGTGSAPNFPKITLSIDIGLQVWEPELELYSHRQGHAKSTMSNQAFGPARNFFEIGFHMSVRVQVGSLAGKCAPLVKAIKNNNAQSGLDPTTNFSKMVLCIFVMVQVGELIGKCAPPPLPGPLKNQHCPTRPFKMLEGSKQNMLCAIDRLSIVLGFRV